MGNNQAHCVLPLSLSAVPCFGLSVFAPIRRTAGGVAAVQCSQRRLFITQPSASLWMQLYRFLNEFPLARKLLGGA